MNIALLYLVVTKKDVNAVIQNLKVQMPDANLEFLCSKGCPMSEIIIFNVFAAQVSFYLTPIKTGLILALDQALLCQVLTETVQL